MLDPIPDGLYSNYNVAEGGEEVLANLTTGDGNTAVGARALNQNTEGESNVAIGIDALYKNTIGTENVAIGAVALANSVNGSENVAIGAGTLALPINGSQNTAIGSNALRKCGGSGNIGIGYRAGEELGGNNGVSNNICIGNPGFPIEENTIRIGTPGVHTQAFIAGYNPFPTGSIITLAQGSPAPAGFTKLGTTSIMYKDSDNHGHILDLDVYKKD